MPRSAVDSKHFFTFIQGLVTESTGITFPENSMVEGDNVEVDISGKAARRKGFDFEEGYAFIPDTISADAKSLYAITFHEWKAVNAQGNVNLWVLQVGTDLYFGDLSAPILSKGYLGKYDLTTMEITHFTAFGIPPERTPLVTDLELAKYAPIQSSYGKGRLFCNSAYLEPFFVEFDDKTGELKIVPIIIEERDFEGLEDGFADEEQVLVAAVSPERIYNLKNQGWVETNPNANVSEAGRSIVEGNNYIRDSGGGSGGGSGGSNYNWLVLALDWIKFLKPKEEGK